MKQRVADMLLGQFVSISVQSLLDNVLQQLAQPCALLKVRAGHNSLHELPALIGLQVYHHGCVCDAHSR